jgi:hypothetical protein
MSFIATLRCALLGAVLMPLAASADSALPVQPIAKSGTCPSGYSTSGAYCKPGAKARAALEKRGSCPSGYSTSGAYCLAGTQARPAVPKIGAGCPSGWSSSGDYCLRNR